MNPSGGPQRFLVIDHNPDSGELLVRSLRRKFPHATLLQTADADEAVKTAASLAIDVIVLHRAHNADAIAVIKALRAETRTVPIVVVSGQDLREKVLATGATAFLNLDAWLMLGTVVANALNAGPGSSESA